MKHTNKNHKRRNNKKRPTKKCNRGGGLWDTINSFTGKSSDGNSTDLNAEAETLFKQLDTSKDEKLNRDEYANLQGLLPGAAKIPYEQVDPNNDGIDFNEFLPLYYFAKVNADGDKTLNRDEYANLQGLLPGAAKIPYEQVDPNNDGIDFNEFLAAYKKSPTGGRRRRRKRSTRNKRKTNKKRRTVKRRKSAKRSHRRK